MNERAQVEQQNDQSASPQPRPHVADGDGAGDAGEGREVRVDPRALVHQHGNRVVGHQVYDAQGRDELGAPRGKTKQRADGRLEPVAQRQRKHAADVEEGNVDGCERECRPQRRPRRKRDPAEQLEQAQRRGEERLEAPQHPRSEHVDHRPAIEHARALKTLGRVLQQISVGQAVHQVVERRERHEAVAVHVLGRNLEQAAFAVEQLHQVRLVWRGLEVMPRLGVVDALRAVGAPADLCGRQQTWANVVEHPRAEH